MTVQYLSEWSECGMKGTRDEESSDGAVRLLEVDMLAPTLTLRRSEPGDRSPSLSLGVTLKHTITSLKDEVQD